MQNKKCNYCKKEKPELCKHHRLSTYTYYAKVGKQTTLFLTNKGFNYAKEEGIDTSPFTRPGREDARIPLKEEEMGYTERFGKGRPGGGVYR